ncbi:MAG: hypothetical protein AAGD47_13925 [Pseudomonadota bacterium]
MKKILTLASAGLCSASLVQAGGLDRTGQAIGPLFEEGGATGSYVELSFGSIYPDVSGTALGTGSGDIADSYVRPGFAFKTEFGDNWSVALIYDRPYEADITYPRGTGYIFEGSTADFNSNALTGILRYKFDNGMSVYGGLRAQEIDAEVFLPPIADYSANAPGETAFGYLVGASYERPDIALRVALTYFSAISHDLEVTETSLATGTVTSPYTQEMPQAVNLDFQTGIAEDTLLFGGIRWVDWSDFTIAPPVYTNVLVGNPLVSYNGNYTTYTLGVGRAFTDEWSGSIALIYEPGVGGFTTNLGPTDGLFGVTLGAKYERDQFEISGGVNVSWLGDAETIVSRDPFLTSDFTDNMAVGIGIRFGYNF